MTNSAVEAPRARRAELSLSLPGPRESAPGPPEWATSMIGRDAELAAVRAALGRERLVSLTGRAGVGKTRLAAAVAAAVASDFPGGVGFAELVPVGPRFLAQSVAVALAVTERPGQPLEQALQERLGHGRCLLVVDGCEHCPDAVAGLVGRLIDGCPGLVVLTTGRAPLALAGEHVRTVEGLPVTEESENGAVSLFLDRAGDPGHERRLAARECSHWHGTPLAVELSAASPTHRLAPGPDDDANAEKRTQPGEGRGPDEGGGPGEDRGPREGRGSGEGIGPREGGRVGEGRGSLEGDRVRCGAGSRDGRWSDVGRGSGGGAGVAEGRGVGGDGGAGGPAEAAVVRAYELLDGDARRLLRRLAVFLRGFDAEAAHLVAADDGTHPAATAALLDRLTDRALLPRALGTRTGRRRMPSAVRAVALERLAAEGDAEHCRDRHLEWAVATAERLRQDAAGADRPEPPGETWRRRFDLVADDLRSALDRSAAHPAPGPHRLARALAGLCYARQFLVESRTHFRTAATLTRDPSQAAADLRAAADVAMAEHRGDLAHPLLREAAEHAAAAGDPAAGAVALAFAACVGTRFPATFPDPPPHRELRALLARARHLAPPGDRLVAAHLAAAEAWNATARKTTPDARLAQAALDSARACGDPVLIAGAIDAVCSGHGAGGRFRDAHRLSDERLRLFDRLPRHDPAIGLEIIDTLHVVPLVALAAGDLPSAVTAARRAWDDPLSGRYMRASKSVAPLALSGRFDEALEYAAAMWDGWLRAGRPAARWMAPAAHAAALVHGLRGDADDRPYRQWRDRARDLAAPWDPHGIAASFAAFADVRVALHRGAVDEALNAAVDLSATPPWPLAVHQFYDAYSWAAAAETAVLAGLPEAGEHLAAAAPAGAQNDWAAACLARAAGRLHGDRGALLESVALWERVDAGFELACTLLLLPDRAAEGLARLTALNCPPPTDPRGTT